MNKDLLHHDDPLIDRAILTVSISALDKLTPVKMVITETVSDIAAHPLGTVGQTGRTGGGQSSLTGRGHTLGSNDDLELMNMPSVVGRESGERDPLLLRDKIMSGEAIDGLKQWVSQDHTRSDVSTTIGLSCLAENEVESWRTFTKLRMSILQDYSSLSLRIPRMANRMLGIWPSKLSSPSTSRSLPTAVWPVCSFIRLSARSHWRCLRLLWILVSCRCFFTGARS